MCEPIPKNFYLRWTAVLATWLFIAAFFAAIGSQSTQEAGQVASPAQMFLHMMLYWLAWALFSPAILTFARHFHLDRGQR